MNKYIVCVLLSLFGATVVVANTTTKISASGGYGMYRQARFSDGLTPIGRLSLEQESDSRTGIRFGIELGLQSGNQMRIKTSSTVYAALGGVAIQSTIKPLIDVLVIARTHVNSLNHSSLFVKVGGALRSMQFDRDTLRNIVELTPELQAGMSQAISGKTKVSLFYQVMYSGKSRLTTNAAGTAGGISHIPLQQALFLGVSMKV